MVGDVGSYAALDERLVVIYAWTIKMAVDLVKVAAISVIHSSLAHVCNVVVSSGVVTIDSALINFVTVAVVTYSWGLTVLEPRSLFALFFLLFLFTGMCSSDLLLFL